MQVLLVKTSSIGDILHTMPALTDAARAVPGIRFDWLVEAGLEEICAWHPAVDQVITVAYRTWRRHPVRGVTGGALRRFRARLRQRSYDLVIDAQGLYKSAVMTAMADGPRHGLDLLSCREKLAPLAYQRRHRVRRDGHAVTRTRQLFAAALDYPLPARVADYGLDRQRLPGSTVAAPYLVFLHGTRWRSKLWPVARWRGLADLAGAAGFTVCLPSEGEVERHRAEAIARDRRHVQVLPPMRLSQMGGLIAGAKAVVAVDTGLGHLSAALEVPSVSLYGPTGPERTGTAGRNQRHLALGYPCAPCRNKICNYTGNLRAPSPCLAELVESRVWAELLEAASDGGTDP